MPEDTARHDDARQRYEYKIVDWKDDEFQVGKGLRESRDWDPQSVLNDYGEDGWQLAQAVQTNEKAQTVTMLILEREVRH